MATFLVPCECGFKLSVRSAQAGDSAACPACGTSIVVPKLRDLARLARDTPDDSALQRRSPAGSGAVVFGAIALALFLGSFMALPTAPRIPVEAHRAAFDQMSESEIYSVWVDMMSKNRVKRPPSGEEIRFQKQYRLGSMTATGLQLLALVAGIAAAVMAVRGWVAKAEAISSSP